MSRRPEGTRRLWWNPVLAVPALIVTIPLAGFPMQNEERRALFRAARVFGSNPLEVASYAYDSMGVFLDAGNFRPVGRFAEKAGYAFAVEAAEATGLALYVVQGMIRLLLVAILAMTAASAVSAVMRSAGVGSAARPTLVLYSLVFATTLVASHHLSSLSAFPVVFIGSAVMVLGVVQLVAGTGTWRTARCRGTNRSRWHSWAQPQP